MTELLTPGLKKFPNLVRNQLFNHTKANIESVGVDVLQIQNEALIFFEHLQKENEAVLNEQGSSKNKQIKAARTKLNDLFYGFETSVEGLQYHFDANIAQAAEQIYNCMLHLDDSTSTALAAETSLITAIVTELSKKLAPQVAMLGYEQWLQEIKQTNDALNNLVLERNEELALRNQKSVTELRPTTEAAYNTIVKRINALIIVNGEQQYSLFVAKQNQLLQQYQTAANIKSGKAAAARDKKAKDNEAM